MLLLKKYLNTLRIEEYVCPASVQLLNLEGLPEDVVKERHPDAFVVRKLLKLFFMFTFSVFLIQYHFCIG